MKEKVQSVFPDKEVSYWRMDNQIKVTIKDSGTCNLNQLNELGKIIPDRFNNITISAAVNERSALVISATDNS